MLAALQAVLQLAGNAYPVISVNDETFESSVSLLKHVNVHQERRRGPLHWLYSVRLGFCQDVMGFFV